ncbi:MAG: hypothetical protein ABIW76_04365 [Fibrobacteria bacterium]
MKRGRKVAVIPIPVNRALKKLGQDISDARRRRRIPLALMAERASINRMTVHKIERGEPGVSMGSYATVLFVLGLIGTLTDLADGKNDPVGLSLEEERLPKRIRTPRPQDLLPPELRSRK